jgi:ferrochelatase
MKWLKPSLIETVEHLASKDRKHLLVIPVAFVTDHIETLHEINIDVRRHAMEHGVQQFELMPALNNHPKFIQCLAELVQAQLASDVQSNTCEALWKNRMDRPIPVLCPWSKS